MACYVSEVSCGTTRQSKSFHEWTKSGRPHLRFSTKEICIRCDPRNGDIILSQSPGSLQEILTALHNLNIPDDFLSPAERAHAQERPQERLDL